MQSNLTTADIAACAARFLADTRGLADRQHAAALAMPGSADALQCARRIDVWLSDCDAACQASEARRASMAQAA